MAGDAVYPSARRKDEEERLGGCYGEKPQSHQVSLRDDFGLYQITILLITQLAYIPVAASLLSTSFLKISKETCHRWSTSSTNDISSSDFHSLLVDWDVPCTEDSNSLVTVISTTIMFGGLGGAFLTGFLADRFGRKPVIIGSLVLLSAANAVLLASTKMIWYASLPIFFSLGGAAGGYMTTNLVLVVESLCSPSSRLLVVALNGWSLSMASTGLIAWLLPYWFNYHMAISVLSLVSACTLFFVADESLRWLKTSRRLREFSVASERLRAFNGAGDSKDVALLSQLDGEDERRSRSSDGSDKIEDAPIPLPTYLDLFRARSLRPRLFSLAYCFLVSSVVSFGFYFAIDSLSGSRYVNLGIMGCGKFLLGLLPFAVSLCTTRKQVALMSVVVATLAAWGCVVALMLGCSLTSLTATSLSLLVAASLDPTWKISHLYSTELFPTTVRNMARGFCNAAARTGSVLAPLTAHWRHELPAVPYSIFATLLTGQLVVTWFFLPNEVPVELMDTVAPSPPDAEAHQEVDRAIEEADSRCLAESTPLTHGPRPDRSKSIC